ncbi:MAG TPA: hypothetical protein VII78_07740 [Myxococcota bacterium]
MSALTPANSAHASTRTAWVGALRALACALLALVALLAGRAAYAQPSASEATEAVAPTDEQAPPAAAGTEATSGEPATDARAEGEPVFVLGPLVYRAARGLAFGDSGLTLGGFSTFEIERPDRGATELALDGLNFIALYEPIDSLRAFAELEIGDLASWHTDGGGVESSPSANFERLYAEYSASNALNFRVGKFLTPVGQWNLAPAEPFVWTATQPAILELGLDEHQTGLAVFGSFYPAKRVVNYWVYGQVVDAFDVESDETPAERSVGARVESSDARGVWTLGASLLASERDGAWSTTGGADAKWRGERLELSSELLLSGGDIPGRDFWGVFVEAAYPLDRLSPKLAKLYLVGRAEHFDPGGARATQLLDFGVTWLPRVWLNFKAGYRAAIRDQGDLRDGLKVSLSVLF